MGDVARFSSSRTGTLALLAAFGAFTVAPSSAHARGLLSPLAGRFVQTSAEEVATTFGSSQTTTWTRLEVSSGGFVWLVPMAPGARADFASDAWLAALDASSAARVTPPTAPAPCNALGGAEVETTVAHGTRLSPSDARLLFGDADLASYGSDLDLDAETQAAAHAVFVSGSSLLALRFAPATGPVRTPTIRITTPSAEGGVVGTTVGTGVHSMFTTVYAIGPGPAAFGGPPVVLGAGALPEITWGALGSNYPTIRFNALLGAGAGRFLVESASHRGLYVTRPDQALQIPSVAESYFGRDACNTQAQSLTTSSARVSRTCAPGSLGWFGELLCDETVQPGETNAHTLRCGGDDYALALSGTAPSALSVTRAVTTGDSAAEIVLGGSESSTVIPSFEYDLACRNAGAAPGSVGGYGGASAGTGGGSGDLGSGSSDPSVGVGVIVDPGPSDACSGDTSSDSSSSSDSCDGTSTDSSDSSSSDSCSSDSGSSSGDGCSGDSGGGGGDACAGGGGGGGGGDCSAARRGHGKKSPFSRLVFVAVAALLVWRRRSRPSQTS
jgi:hypothetical protein